VGSPLTQVFTSAPITADVLAANASLPESGANIASPVSGVIVRWRIVQAVGGPFRLRVLRPLGGSTYMPVATSAPASASSLGVQTFSTNLPIRAGDTVAIEATLVSGNQLGLAGPVTGANYIYWAPPLAEGASGTGTAASQQEVGFNADVQPPPTISAISPGSGSFTGGTSVKITGTDFEGASAVTFGGSPAKSFTVDSEDQITAVGPATPRPVSLPVAVTTVAGTATGATAFTTTACVVPKLTGKSLNASKKKLKKANCKLGSVKKVEGATAKTGKIVKQNPKPGKVLAPGTKIKVTIGGRL
jgi:hypothetical protein